MRAAATDEALAVQREIWRAKTVAEKFRLTGQLWLQARSLKRAMLRHLHPEWSDSRIETEVRKVMRGDRS